MRVALGCLKLSASSGSEPGGPGAAVEKGAPQRSATLDSDCGAHDASLMQGLAKNAARKASGSAVSSCAPWGQSAAANLGVEMWVYGRGCTVASALAHPQAYCVAHPLWEERLNFPWFCSATQHPAAVAET